MKQGFVLIEILFASAIASLISISLFAAFYQANRSTQILDNIIEAHTNIIILSNLMEKDISGAFIPLQVYEDKKNKKEGDKKTDPDEKKSKPALTKIFFSSNQNGMLDILTFITNNPLQGYWDDETGSLKPRIARVVYHLREEKGIGSKKSYALYRQESSNLDFEAFKKDAAQPVREYQVVDRIKKLSVSYTQEITKKEQTTNGEKVTKEYKKVDDWDTDEPGAVNKDTVVSKLPYSVSIDVAFWDMKKERERSFVVTSLVFTNTVEGATA